MTVQVKSGTDTVVRLNQPSVQKKNLYLPALTALRGIAALWVLLFHLDVIIFYRDLGAIFPHQWSGLITQGYLWVDFFFILSGFIICHIYGEQLSGRFQGEQVKQYLIARFFRIYPLHIFTLLLLVGFAVVVPLFLPNIIDDSWQVYFDWQALISNLLLTNSMNQHTYLSWNIVSWSIGAEWWAYIYGVGLLYLVANSANKGMKYLVIIAVGCFIGLTTLVYFSEKHTLDITFDFGFLRCIFEFSLGVITYKIYQTKIGIQAFQQDRYFMLTLLAICIVFQWQFNDLFIIPLFIILVLCAAFNQHNVVRVISLPRFQYLGQISYSIYLMHGVWFMVFWFTLPIIKRTWLIDTLSLWQIALYIISFITLTLVSAAFSYRYIEVPFRYSFNKKSPARALIPPMTK